MKMYTYKGFGGYWPVGTSAVVVAKDRKQAKELLEKELEKIGLKQDLQEDSFKEVLCDKPSVDILQDGDY